MDIEPQEYNVSIHTNDIHEALAGVANALYGLAEEALASHDDHEAEECEFEQFARDVLGVLTRHAEHLSSVENPWEDADQETLNE